MCVCVVAYVYIYIYIYSCESSPLPIDWQSTVTPPSSQTLSRTNSRSTVKKIMIAPKYDLLLWGDHWLAVHACSAQQNMHVCISTWNVFNTVTKTVKLYSWRGSLLLLMFHFTGIFYATATSQPAASPRLFKLPSSYLMSVDLILLSRNIGCVSHSLALRSSLWSFTFTSASSAHDLSI